MLFEGGPRANYIFAVVILARAALACELICITTYRHKPNYLAGNFANLYSKETYLDAK